MKVEVFGGSFKNEQTVETQCRNAQNIESLRMSGIRTWDVRCTGSRERSVMVQVLTVHSY